MACLLILLVGHLHFCLIGSVDLTIGLAIGGMMLIARKVTVSLSE